MVRIGRTDNIPDFSLLEENWYELTVVEGYEKKSKAGNPYLKIKFEVSGLKRPYFENYPNDQRFLYQRKHLVKAIDENLCAEDLDTDDLVGKRVMAYIIVDGNFNKIKKYAPVEGFNPEDLKPKDKPEKEETDEDLPF